MAWYPSLVTRSLLWLSMLAGLSVSQDWTLNPQKDLAQMASHMSAVVNNTIYTIGGTVYYWVPKSVYSSMQSSNNNSAYIIKTTNSYLRALDLSKPMNLEPQFSDQTEIISELPFEIPHVRRGAFWADGNVLYLWGGSLEAEPIFQNGAFQNRTKEWPDPTKYYTYDLLQLKGSGTWKTVSIETGNGSDKLTTSPASGGYAYSPEARKGFYLGGFMERYETKNKDGSNATKAGIKSYPVSGMAVFDLETKVWKNETTSAELNEIRESQMVYVEGVGEQGILVVMGGKNWAGYMFPFDRVYVYDIATKTWYRQTTTSNTNIFPDPREGAFCAGAVAATDRSSFTIYIYGGSTPNGGMVKGTWALTMPYFQWLPVSSSGEPAVGRYMTSCQVIGGQMAMVRGRTNNIELVDENGGSFFYDMTNLTWSNRYTPRGEYAVPKIIYNLIGGNGQGGARITGPADDKGFSSGLGRLFAAAAANSSTRESPSPSPTTLHGDPTKSNTGTIAGGVVGSLAGLALLGAGIWIFTRRRGRRAGVAMEDGAMVRTQENSLIGVHKNPLVPGYKEGSSPGRYEIDGVPVKQLVHKLDDPVQYPPVLKQ